MNHKLQAILLAQAVFLLSCSDAAPDSVSSRDAAQSDTARIAFPNDDAALDAAPPDVQLIVPLDMSPVPIDAAPDAAPPQICERLGLREPCEIEGLLGPCATGEKVCQLTYWSPCSPVSFSRTEICDALDNDCDGKLNEAPNNLGEGHLDPQNLVLSRSCYTGRDGSSNEGICRPGISLCQEMTRDTDAGAETYYDYGLCEPQVLRSEEV